MRKGLAVIALLFCLLLGVAAWAQEVPAQPDNVFAAGVSFNSGASPAVAGTGLYAHKVADSGTYAFTVMDVLPNNHTDPFTVNSNFGFGIAQKVATIAKVPIYVPTSAGVSVNGDNLGWAWSTGALASIKLKGDWRIMPHVRVVKSSVSNGTGYQPIVGVLFGWAK